MEAIVPAIVILVTTLGLVVFDILALRYGVESRPTIGDDHARPLGIR